MPEVTFKKNDQDKPRPGLLPLVAVDQLIGVLEYGAKKYAAENWRKCEDIDRYYNAALRHLFAWKRGERIDPESGLPHMAHAACSLMFALEIETIEID